MRAPKLRLYVCVVTMLLVACSGGEEERPDIVLVTIDTLRADHLGCYGYFRDTSPHLDALADEGLLFERAITTMGTTLPAHLSLMTGLYPHQHGYVANHGAVPARFTSRPGRRPVAEILREAGYTTAAFVSGPTVSKKTGIQEGFETFDEHEIRDFGDVRDFSRRAEVTTKRALDWLETEPRRPFFLWVHYWDPHEPNAPREPYASMFEADAQLDVLIDERRIDPATLRARFSDLELARLFAPELLSDLDAGREVEMPPIDRDAVRDLIDRYDGDVRNVDDRLGELFAALRARGLWQESIVVVTADHGQALGQHDWLEHGRIQLEETHVPLVMRIPVDGVPLTGRRREVVSLVDVMPTLLARLGGRPERALLEQAEGADLLSRSFDRPWAFSQRSVRDREWGPEDPGQHLQFALTLEEWRYYRRPDGKDELYHLPDDPGELHDVLEEHPDLARELAAIVQEVAARRPYDWSGEEADGDAAKQRDLLKKMGYAGDE